MFDSLENQLRASCRRAQSALEELRKGVCLEGLAEAIDDGIKLLQRIVLLTQPFYHSPESNSPPEPWLADPSGQLKKILSAMEEFMMTICLSEDFLHTLEIRGPTVLDTRIRLLNGYIPQLYAVLYRLLDILGRVYPELRCEASDS